MTAFIKEDQEHEKHERQEHCQGRHCFRLEEMAPDFKLPAYHRGKQIEVSLEECRGCWTVLFFYSSDFTFV